MYRYIRILHIYIYVHIYILYLLHYVQSMVGLPTHSSSICTSDNDRDTYGAVKQTCEHIYNHLRRE